MTTPHTRRSLFGLLAGASALAVAGPVLSAGPWPRQSQAGPDLGYARTPVNKTYDIVQGFRTSPLIEVSQGSLFFLSMDEEGIYEKVEYPAGSYTVDENGDHHITAPERATRMAMNFKWSDGITTRSA